MADDISIIKNTLRGYRGQLLEFSNVMATGVGYKITGGQKTSNLSIICSVTRKQPTNLESYPVRVQTVGKIKAQ